MVKKESIIERTVVKIERMTVIRSVRNGLVDLIPVLIIGAFALILQTFPVDAYQEAVASIAGGFFLKLLEMVYSATFGMLSVYMVFSISYEYMKIKADPEVVSGGANVASLLAFFILTGTYLPTFGTDSTGPKSMFLAIITALGASDLYLAFDRRLRNHRNTLYTSGADREFNLMLSTLVPITLVALITALINVTVIRIFDVDSFRQLLSTATNELFAHIGSGFFKGLFFVLLSSLLWFFGIHGSDTLEEAMQINFAPGLAENQAAAAAGLEPTQILSKEFFDCFVFMGGCGATICLLLAILLFSHNRARRGLGLAAAFPMAFNINELMVFGLPIIVNPVMMIPFLTVPLVCYTTAYLALSLGAVPLITNEVAWTTPIVLGGLRATGTVSGAVLQVFNVLLGVLIYFPFVRLLDWQSEERAKHDYEEFVTYFKKNEAELTSSRLIDHRDIYGDFARSLLLDLRHGMDRQITLYYQPQVDYSGKTIGVESLLRWKHPVHGIVYPPLVIKLAEDGRFLEQLEESILRRAIADRPRVLERFGQDVKISVNVTGTDIVTPQFLQFCSRLNEETPFKGMNLCLEVTEQATLNFNDETRAGLLKLKEIGFKLAIDDFSMGQTSLNYLKDSLFDIIKLDGSLIRGLSVHENVYEIIASITSLANSLGMIVLAEYVETEEQRETLHSVGCDVYQGWLYSPAVSLDEKEKK